VRDILKANTTYKPSHVSKWKYFSAPQKMKIKRVVLHIPSLNGLRMWIEILSKGGGIPTPSEKVHTEAVEMEYFTPSLLEKI